MAERLLDVWELAERIGHDGRTVTQWRDRRLLPAPNQVSGGGHLWSETTIDAWWEENRGVLVEPERRGPRGPYGSVERSPFWEVQIGG